jgi:hypothetical protein
MAMPDVHTARASFLVYLAAKGLRPVDLDAWEWAHYTRTFYTWLGVLALLDNPLLQTRTRKEIPYAPSPDPAE